MTGMLFVFQPPLPTNYPVAVFVEGGSQSRCTRKFLKQVPGMAKLREQDPKAAAKLMLFSEEVQLTVVEKGRSN